MLCFFDVPLYCLCIFLLNDDVFDHSHPKSVALFR